MQKDDVKEPLEELKSQEIISDSSDEETEYKKDAVTPKQAPKRRRSSVSVSFCKAVELQFTSSSSIENLTIKSTSSKRFKMQRN